MKWMYSNSALRSLPFLFTLIVSLPSSALRAFNCPPTSSDSPCHPHCQDTSNTHTHTHTHTHGHTHTQHTHSGEADHVGDDGLFGRQIVFLLSGRGRFLFFLVIWCRWLFPLLRLTIKGI